MSGIRTYEVEYLINANGNAASYFKTLAEGTAGMVEPLKQMEANIGKLSSTLKSFKQDETLKNLFTIKPTIDTSTFQTQLKNMQEAVKVAAEKMSMELNKALAGAASFKPIDLKKAVADSKKEMSARLTDLEKTWNKLAPGKDIRTARSRSVNSEAWKIRNQYKDTAKQLGIWAKASKDAQQVINSATTASQIEDKAAAITKLNRSLSKFTAGKSYKVKISADISQAVAKINTLLTTIRESTAAIPVTLAGENKSAKGKSISKTGKTTKTGAKNVQTAVNNDIMSSLLKGQEQAATIKINADVAPALEQLKALLEKISTSAAKIPVSIASAAKEKTAKGKTAATKEDLASKLLAGKKQSATLKIDADTSPALTKITKLIEKVQSSTATMPVMLTASSKTGKTKGDGTKTKTAATDSALANIVKGKEQVLDIKAKFDGSQLVAQLTESIANLQNIAKERPVIIRGSFNGSEAGFQLNQSIANLQKLANSRPVVLNTTMSSTGAKANDGTMPPTPIASTKESGGTKQTSGGSVSKGGTSSQESALIRWENSIKQSQLNNWASALKQEYAERARLHGERQAMYEKLWRPLTPGGIPNERVMSAIDRTNAQEIARLKAYNQAAQPQATTASPTMLATSAKASSFPRRATIKAPKVPDPWYQFTGNTSFGARTPMAIDMAKGMGTMFAIGGAMSAVGNSLHQAMSYQNTMRTTQAIFKHGKTPYSDSDFTDMEQTARQIGRETKFTAPQVAQATKFLAMAGYNAKESKEAIKPIADIALIGDTDLGETADKLTNVMTAFGKNPKQMQDVADIMTTTFTRSNTDMMMLAESAKYAGGIANLYGGNFKNNFADVMAMFGIMGNAGIQASSAGTTLRMMYQNLMKPNKTQRATLKQYGIFTRDTNGQPLEMTDILMQIQKKVPQNKMADAIGNMFRITAQPGAAALATHIDDLIDLMQANRAAAGSGITEQIVDEKKNTIQGLWAQVQSTFTEGILQAFEGQEGGWAKQLADLRDYLARPETVDMLKSIVSLVETLANTLSWFAKLWANAYNLFPGIINGWMKVQLTLTQIGFLVTPFRQLYKVMQSLGAMMNGMAASTTTLTFAEQGIARARQANAATNLIGSAAPVAEVVGARGGVAANASRGLVVSKAANNGLVAASLAAGMYHYTPRKTKMHYRLNPNMATSSALMMLAPYSASPLYKEFSQMDRQRQRISNLKEKLARNKRGLRVRAKWTSSLSYAPMAYQYMGQSPIVPAPDQHRYYRPAQNKVLPLNQYSGQTGAALLGGQVIADRAASYRYRAYRWGRIARAAEAGKINGAWGQVATMRAEQYTNAAILAAQQAQAQRLAGLRDTRRVRQLRNTALLDRYDARFGANEMTRNARASLTAQQAARHAARGPVAISTAARVARRGGWGAQAFAITNGFAAGMQAGSFGKLGIWGSLKSGFATLMGGLAKAIGMLASPIGLVTLAIGSAVTATLTQIKRIKDKQAEGDKEADDKGKQGKQARDKAYAPIHKFNDEKRSIGRFLQPIKDTEYQEKAKKQRAQYFKYIDAFAVDASSDKAQRGWLRGVMDNPNTRLAFGNGDLLYKRGRKIASEKTFKESVNYNGDDYDPLGILSEQRVKSRNSNAANARSWEAVFLEGATNNDILTAQKKIIQLREQLIAKKINQAEFDKKANDIRMSAANPKANGLLDVTEYTASEIKNHPNWSKFMQFQQGGWNVLTAELNAGIGTYSGYLQGIDQLKEGVQQYSEQWWQAIARVYDGLEYPFKTIKGTVNLVLNALPNGRIDTSKIIQQIKQIANNLQLNISDFAKMASSIYQAMAQIGVVPGKYYSDYIRFTKEQTKHANVTAADAAAYWDRYIGKGNKNVKWHGMTKEEYVDYVKTGGAGGSDILAAKERAQIRGRFATNAGINAKKQADQAKKNAEEQKKNVDNITGSTSGTNAGGDGDKNKQKDYQNTYDRSAARPTQVIINIDNLARFDRTAVVKDADDKALIESIESKIAEAVAMLSSQALNSAGSLIAQNV